MKNSSENKSIPILIADDHPIVRKGLRQVIGEEALALKSKNR